MNLSGRAVAALARFFAIAPAEILVAHDELDLLPGEAKMKFGGGNAGHNGLRDIDAQLGTSEFWRLRLGIGHPRDSAIPQQDVVDYVLRPPFAAERAEIGAAIDRALAAWPAIASGDFERAMLLLHTKDGKTQGHEMSLKCGIVGLPNVGKSTLFNALTKAGIAAENYPFCTIEPNVGIVEVPDPRLAALAAIARPEKVIPATVEFVDIAGLVAGASKGEGLGNQFLANIRETDAIAHVVRCFEDDNVVHVAGKVNPISDIETIDTELALADLAAVEKQLSKYEKLARSGGDKEAQRIVAALKKVEAVLDQGSPARAADLYAEERDVLRPFFLLTMKPTMYVANVGERGFHDNPLLAVVEAHAAKEGAPVVAGVRVARGGDRRSRRRRQARVSRRPGARRARPRPRDPRRLQAARPRNLPDGRAEGSACVDDPRRRDGAAGGRRDPHRFREGLHPRRGDCVRRLHRMQGRARCEGARKDAARRTRLRREGRRRHALPLQRLVER